MAREVINVGAVANDGTGEPVRNAYIKVNNMTQEIYTALGDGALLNATVSKVGTPVSTQVGVWTGNGTIAGASSLAFDDINGYLGIGANPDHLINASDTIPRVQINDEAGSVGTGIIDNRIRMEAGGSRAFEIGFLSTSNGQVSLRNFVPGDMSFRISSTNSHKFRFEENNGLDILATIDGIGLGIGLNTPNVSIDVGDRTDAIELPKGTAAQRPDIVTGRMRYNEDINVFEGYSGSSWHPMSSYDVTFTPVVADDNAGGNAASATTSYGRVTRVGNMVTVTMRVDGIDTSGLIGANDVWIRGIPAAFSAHNDVNAEFVGSAHTEDVTIANNPVVAYLNSSERNAVRLVEARSALSENFITVADLITTTASINVTITYITNAAT